MNLSDQNSPAEGDLTARDRAALHRSAAPNTRRTTPPRWFKALGVVLVLVAILAIVGFFGARYWMQASVRDNLPVIDGQVTVAGLAAQVTVARDAHGVPHLRAGSIDDLVFAQAYITAGDRLWQMDILRRHAAGELAEILGTALIPHDRTQRTLQTRAAVDRALAVLPPDQMHWLQTYARGVNASIAAQQAHLPLEFKLLRYKPAPWTPRDSLLVGLAMFQDLTMTYPEKLDREALSSKLAPELLADLYPVGSWRDHPVAQQPVDLTAPQPEIQQVPLDESQSQLHPSQSNERIADLARARVTLAALSARFTCDGCIAGSNGWAVAGSKTKSGKPMLASDMHLSFGVPGIWYEADLQAGDFHVSGVTLPGTPFVIVGHNQHVAWGFTNLGADVQDLSVEQTRGTGSTAEYQTIDGTWQPLLHQREVIHVKGTSDVTMDVMATLHNGMATPIIAGLGTGLYPHEQRTIALRWTIYDPANLTSPFYGINTATDSKSLCAAFASFGGPSQNMQYADDQGHIGYHAVGRVPVRGSMTSPAALSPVPASGRDPDRAWVGYIPFDQMPQSFDPPDGVVATANARVVPDGFPFPVTLDWSAPYRNERIWKVLQAKSGLVPADMLTLQTDVYSDLDKEIGQRLAYAIDHAASVHAPGDSSSAKRLRQAADLIRVWDGTVAADSAPAAIVDAARKALWPMILAPQLGLKDAQKPSAEDEQTLALYSWGEKQYAEEQIVVHQPARWLPMQYADWNELLAAAVQKGLTDEKAPGDLSKWKYGAAHPVDIEHPVYTQSPLLGQIFGMRTGTGPHPQSGDTSTVKQVSRTLGPSERLTVDFSDLDHSTLNVVLGESANPASPWFMDEWMAWYHGTTFAMPFSDAAVAAATSHTLTLVP